MQDDHPRAPVVLT